MRLALGFQMGLERAADLAAMASAELRDMARPEISEEGLLAREDSVAAKLDALAEARSELFGRQRGIGWRTVLGVAAAFVLGIAGGLVMKAGGR